MRTIPVLALAAVLLAGCAHPWSAASLTPGTPREQVLAQAGPPYRVVPLANGGQRLQYPNPAGRQALMIDLDAAGRLVSVQQVLHPAHFNRIETDQWTRADVEREFGPPYQVDGVTSWIGPIYTYRWWDRNERMFYWVYFDPQGVVRRHHPGIDHINTPNNTRS
jgi:hypothetical protein